MMSHATIKSLCIRNFKRPILAIVDSVELQRPTLHAIIQKIACLGARECQITDEPIEEIHMTSASDFHYQV